MKVKLEDDVRSSDFHHEKEYEVMGVVITSPNESMQFCIWSERGGWVRRPSNWFVPVGLSNG